MQATYNSYLADITELAGFVQPRRKTLIDRLIGRLAIGQIHGGQFLYEIHGPYVVPAQPARPQLPRPIKALKAVAVDCYRWWASHRAAREMARLDDRTLKDIGLTRLEIDVAAWGHLRRKADD